MKIQKQVLTCTKYDLIPSFAAALVHWKKKGVGCDIKHVLVVP